FHWRMLESADYEKYIANLRSVGCPEKTIRDIIVADVEKLYAGKIAASPLGSGFWSSGPTRAAAQKRQQEQRRALEDEKRALRQQLLGTEIDPQFTDKADLIEQALLRFMFGPMPEDVLERVASSMKQTEARQDNVSERANNILLPEDEAEIEEIGRQCKTELKQLL